MKYSPLTPQDKQDMLSTMNKQSFSSLIEDIPLTVELPGRQGLTELETKRHIKSVLGKNKTGTAMFLGAGAYNHYIPSVIDHLAGRSEFYTAYTPYQPEISQGTLTAIFEFQSMITALTGMDIANASLYDGATATAEAAILATSATARKKVLISETLHPEYITVLKTYLTARSLEYEIKDLFATEPDDQTAGFVYACPDFFGAIRDYSPLIEKVHAQGGLFIAVADPLSLAVLEAPGALNADIAVGEAQPLGIPLSFGGPYLGYMAVKEKFLRNMPGRIVGATQDIDGKRAFVLTFQTREQHIRREKATSNICSNQALCALRATIYLSVMGEQGLKTVARTCMNNAAYLKDKLSKIPGFFVDLAAPSFREFVLKTPVPAEAINAKLWVQADVLGGLPLNRYFPARENELLVCTTEVHSRQDLDTFISICTSFSA